MSNYKESKSYQLRFWAYHEDNWSDPEALRDECVYIRNKAMLNKANDDGNIIEVFSDLVNINIDKVSIGYSYGYYSDGDDDPEYNIITAILALEYLPPLLYDMFITMIDSFVSSHKDDNMFIAFLKERGLFAKVVNEEE